MKPLFCECKIENNFLREQVERVNNEMEIIKAIYRENLQVKTIHGYHFPGEYLLTLESEVLDTEQERSRILFGFRMNYNYPYQLPEMEYTLQGINEKYSAKIKQKFVKLKQKFKDSPHEMVQDFCQMFLSQLQQIDEDFTAQKKNQFTQSLYEEARLHHLDQ